MAMRFICGHMMPVEPEQKQEQPQGKAESTSKNSASALFAAVLVAILTGAISYGYGVASDIRKTKIAFVDEQIQKLYGPLYSKSQANNAVWCLFTTQRWRDKSAPDESDAFFDDGRPPTIEQVHRWRRWIRTVFQPLNIEMEAAITSNTQLLVGDDIPAALSSLIAHTEAYKAVVAGWGADEDLKDCKANASQMRTGSPCPALTTFRNTGGANYPDGVIEYVATDYLRIKQLRDRLEASFLGVFSKSKLERSAACDRPYRSNVGACASSSPHL